MKFRNLKLGTKQFIGFGLILIIFAAVLYYTLERMSRLNDAVAEFNDNWLPRAVAVSNINRFASELRLNQIEFAFASDAASREEQTQNMINIIDKINENLDEYARVREKYSATTVYSEKEQSLFQSFDQKWENYQELSLEFFRYAREEQSQEAIDLLKNEADLVYNNFREDLNNLVELYQTAVLELTNNAALTFNATRSLTMLLMFIAIGFSLFFAIILVRLTVIPVRQLEKAAKEVAEGNLNVQLSYSGKDEIGSMAQSFNQMTRSLLAARGEAEMHSSRLHMQWEVLKETNEELEEKSQTLLKQKNLIERKNKDLQKTLQKLKSTQNQLVQAEKMASLGQLTAGIAHEINNPINFITSNIVPLRKDIEDVLKILYDCDDILAKCKLVPEIDKIKELKNEIDYNFVLIEIGDLLNGIEEGGMRTKEIIKGLRNFSRLDEDVMKLADINECIESTLLMLRNQMKNRIEIKKDLQNIPHILCFPGKLNQVFMNILANAIQAIENSGLIRIQTREEKKHVIISIKDNGKGMSEDVQKRIFEPFYTTKEVGQGTGLGLSISYGIIKDHDGHISVKSKINKGTEFIITIPAKR